MKAAFATVLILLFAGCTEFSQTPEPTSNESVPFSVQHEITWTPEHPFPGEMVSFALESNAAPMDIRWHYGDGTSGPDSNHEYKSNGLMEVKAQYTSTEGLFTAFANLTVGTLSEGVPVAPENGGNDPEVAQPSEPEEEVVAYEDAPFSIVVDGGEATIVAKVAFLLNDVRWGDGTKDQELTHSYPHNGEWEITIFFDDVKRTMTTIKTDGFEPHVVVAIPDSGINPYHELYYRPHRTEHPCTYVEGYPCDIPELPLSIGKYDTYAEAWAADEQIFREMPLGQWFWIPQTTFIGVMCEGSTNAAGEADAATGAEDVCLIDDSSMHGTGTTSSVIMENPDALLIFKEGNSGTEVFENEALQIDIISYSWGAAVPLALGPIFYDNWAPFFVAASGNEGAFPVVLDATKAHPSIINIGAGDSETQTEPGYSGWKTMDYVSEYCRPTAQTQSISEIRERYCGTSFSAPTFAGALSSIVLDLRRESGYTGAMVNGMVDPILGIDKWQVRDALNATATYEPKEAYDPGGDTVPLVAPWYQWGWGYFAKEQVPAALACIRENECPERPAETEAYMDLLWTYRTTTAV